MARHQRDAKLEQFWRRQLKQQAQSGLTARDYCREHGLQEPSFYGWRRIIGERDRESASPAIRVPPPSSQPALPAFLPVTLVEPPHRRDAFAIDIQLPGGHRVRVRSGCDRALLADVLAILQSVSTREEQPC